MASFFGTAGNDTQNGSNVADTFDYSQGGDDTLSGKDGGDTFLMGGALTVVDHIDGGAGSDVVTFDGDYSAGLVLGAATLVSVESLTFEGGHDYNVTTDDNTATFVIIPYVVDASALGAHDTFAFNASAERKVSYEIHSGASDDVLTGGRAQDFLYGGDGTDTFFGGRERDFVDAGNAADTLNGDQGEDVLYGGAGLDTFYGGADGDQMFGGSGQDKMFGGGGSDGFTGGAGRDVIDGDGGGGSVYFITAVSDSIGAECDRIKGFDASTDLFAAGPVGPSAIDAMVTTGTLNNPAFDADMELAIGSSQLGAGHAVVFEPNGGDGLGRAYLILDGNNAAGYQAGQDVVIDLTNGQNLGAITVGGNFV